MDDESKVRAAVSMGWHRQGAIGRPHVGLNRRTWRIGEDLWITGTDSDNSDLLHRENALLARLDSLCRTAKLGFNVPRVIATTTGDDVFHYDSCSFRTTAHLPGIRPDDNSVTTFLMASAALRTLHAALQ